MPSFNVHRSKKPKKTKTDVSKCGLRMPNVDVLIKPELPWQQSLSARGTDLHPESGGDTKRIFIFWIGRIFKVQPRKKMNQ